MPLDTRADFTQVAVGTRAVQICPPLGKGVTVTIYNADTTNVVSVSYNPTGQPSIPIQPLTSAVLDASYALYASAPVGTQPVSLMPGGGSLSPSPAQIATQINALGLAKDATVTGVAKDTTVSADAARIAAAGVPLLAGKVTTQNQTTHNAIVKNTTVTDGPFTFAQMGYELLVSASAAAAGVGPDYCQIQLQWSDSTSGATVAVKQFTIIAGSSAAAHSVICTGPVRGDRLTILVTNRASSAENINVIYTLLQTSRIYSRERVRTLSASTFAALGFTTAGASGSVIESNNVINVSPAAVAAGATATRAMTLYSGQVYLKARTNSNTTDLEVAIRDPSSLLGNDGTVYHNWSDSHGDINDALQLPPINCLIDLINHNAAAETLSACITTAELEV